MADFTVGIVGPGGIARAHAKACAAVPGVRVKAVAGGRPGRAQAFGQQYGVPDVYDDYAGLLRDPAIDAVIICTPNALHAPMAVAALEAGKHVLVEKPLADSGAAAAAVAEAQRATGRTVAVALNNRFRQDVRLARQYAREDCGEIYYARCGCFRRRGIPAIGSHFTRRDLSGGGPLVDIGVHMLDLCLDFMGYPEPVSVSGAVYAKFGPAGRGEMPNRPGDGTGVYDVEDLASAHIRLANGATVVLEVSWALDTNDRDWVEVMGTRGGVRLAEGKVQVFSERYGRPVDLFPQIPSSPPEQMRTDLVAHFVHCCRTGEEPVAGVWHGLLLNRIFDAIYASGADGGRQVAIARP
jgi:predicted dehydrogenase